MRTKNIYFSDKEKFRIFVEVSSFQKEKNLLIQVFSSELNENVLESILSDIKEVLPHALIIGATTDGEILGSEISTDKVVISISAFENATLNVAIQENLGDDYVCGAELAKKIVVEDTKVCLLFSDGLGMNGDFFLDGFNSISGDIPIAGGMAGDGANFKKTYIFCNQGIITHGAVGLSINAKKLHVNTTYSFFWQEIGKPLVITKAKDNCVYEIDNKRALDVYARYLGKDVAESLPATGIEFPLIITRNGVKIARAIVGKDDNGALFFAGNLEVGDKVHFGYGNSNMILQESVMTRESFQSSAVESIFIYSCMARRRFLKNAISAEIAPLASMAPTSGFFTYGEFFKDTKCELLNQTMTVIALSENDEINHEQHDYNYFHKDIVEAGATYKALSHLIQETSSELKETNDNLERLVELKTQELQDKILELEHASKVKSDFLANMSHEIRTPLNAILGFVDILRASEDNKEKLSHLNIIKNSGDTLLTVINDILDFSKIESGKMLLEQRRFVTKEPFLEVSELFYEKAKEELLDFQMHFTKNIPKFFVGDKIRIKQVVTNLLSNAIKFTPKGGKVLAKLDFNEATDELTFSVKDTGIGIDKESLEKIFESFSQADVSTTRRFGGTGLGLSISSALIQSMGGSISVESTLGEGSEFSFTLGMSESLQDELYTSHEKSKKIDINQQLDATVLLVEDNKTNQMLMNIILGDIGIKVDLAENGLEAVKKFETNKYDLILMDENMPKMSGIEATKIILNIENERKLEHTPIVALTANALVTDREKFLNAGMDEFVSKPIDHEAFIGVLHSFLLKE